MTLEVQYDTTFRNSLNDLWESDIGTSPKLRYCTGSRPANVAAAQTGTQLVEMTLPADWMAASAAGVKAKLGTWSGTASAGSSSTPGYWRLLTSASVAKRQGLITSAFKLTTNASTAAYTNTLKFASAAGVSAGMSVSGTGVDAGTTVSSISGADVILSKAVLAAGVGSGVDIYFGDTTGSIWHNGTISSGQTVTIGEFSITAPGA